MEKKTFAILFIVIAVLSLFSGYLFGIYANESKIVSRINENLLKEGMSLCKINDVTRYNQMMGTYKQDKNETFNISRFLQ